jgi:hypothetical protein
MIRKFASRLYDERKNCQTFHHDFPLHEHTRSCKRSADTGPSKYTGCSESCPFCRLYSNGGGIWGFATCQAVQIWVSSISAASDGDNLTKLASRLVATITRNLHIVRLCGVHGLSIFIFVSSKLWADGGLHDLLVDSDVYAGNTVEQMLKGK